jgi:hypothetical protein
MAIIYSMNYLSYIGEYRDKYIVITLSLVVRTILSTFSYFLLLNIMPLFVISPFEHGLVQIQIIHMRICCASLWQSFFFFLVCCLFEFYVC